MRKYYLPVVLDSLLWEQVYFAFCVSSSAICHASLFSGSHIYEAAASQNYRSTSMQKRKRIYLTKSVGIYLYLILSDATSVAHCSAMCLPDSYIQYSLIRYPTVSVISHLDTLVDFLICSFYEIISLVECPSIVNIFITGS